MDRSPSKYPCSHCANIKPIPTRACDRRLRFSASSRQCDTTHSSSPKRSPSSQCRTAISTAESERARARCCAASCLRRRQAETVTERSARPSLLKRAIDAPESARWRRDSAACKCRHSESITARRPKLSPRSHCCKTILKDRSALPRSANLRARSCDAERMSRCHVCTTPASNPKSWPRQLLKTASSMRCRRRSLASCRARARASWHQERKTIDWRPATLPHSHLASAKPTEADAVRR
mmetsp:Transcript_102517/g.296479  ORF Transcript_102517/g.296479 Transcript_102517/m.296479 type:complete len:238 (+) Transcript_102517:310-1023(+)